MDKVQFNQQLVGMRKVIKQAKVRVIHQLTRQIQRLQNKSGSTQQVEKNKRRAERLGAEIEYIKKFSPDEVTVAAVKTKKDLAEVCKQPNASAKDRAMARLTNYGHVQNKVSQFKDMVDSDFFKVGKRKLRKIKKERAEARLKKEEEEEESEDQQNSNKEEGSEEEESDENSADDSDDSSGQDNKMMKEQMEDQSSEESESADMSLSDNADDSTKSLKNSPKISKSQKSIRTAPVAVDLDDKPVTKRKSKSSFFASADTDDNDDVEQDEGISSGEEKITSQNLEQDFKGFASELKTNESIKDFLRSRTAEGKKTLDSVFMGSLSGKKTPVSGHQQRKKNRAGQRERQRKGKMNDPAAKKTASKNTNDSKQAKPQRKVAMVDRPNVVRPASSGEKMVPGINCFRNKMNPGKTQETNKVAPKTSEKLHPSWEAKRRKKEQEAKPVAFEGKKITFDDD